MFLEMLVHVLRNIPGYTSCKCWTYPAADVPRNVGYTFNLPNVEYLACFTSVELNISSRYPLDSPGYI